MFSRLAFRGGVQVSSALRTGTTTQPIVALRFHTDTKDIARTQQIIDNWDACKQKYYGPDRDTANYPHKEHHETAPPVTLGFIPRSWVDALYDKTGVSGPFFTLGGLAVYLMSKEILVKDHAFFETIAFWGAVYFITTKFGPSITNFFSGMADRVNDAMLEQPIRVSRDAFTKAVDKIDAQIVEEGRHPYVYDVQQENLDMQLEARYRERVAQVYGAVKRRLDYQVELVNTKKRLEQQHMVDWIVSNVVQGITPKQEKDAIASCISNLKALSKTNPAV